MRQGGDIKATVRHWCLPAEQSESSCSQDKVHHDLHAQADTDTAVRVAMWRTCVCTPRLFDDRKTLRLMIFRRVQRYQSVEV